MSFPSTDFVEQIKRLSGPEGGLSTIALPDNTIHVMLHSGDRILMKAEKAEGNSMSGNWICGQLIDRKSFFIPAKSDTVIIKFKPWANSAIFGKGLFELVNQERLLEEFLPPQIHDVLTSDTIDLNEKLRGLINHLQACLNLEGSNIGLIHAIGYIECNHGNVRVDKLAEKIGLSRRNLERNFKEHTGLTIKKFINNTRFQHGLYLLRSHASISEIVFTCGYFDQSHFIDEFKERTGVTPSQFIKKNLAQNFHL